MKSLSSRFAHLSVELEYVDPLGAVVWDRGVFWERDGR